MSYGEMFAWGVIVIAVSVVIYQGFIKPFIVESRNRPCDHE